MTPKERKKLKDDIINDTVNSWEDDDIYLKPENKEDKTPSKDTVKPSMEKEYKASHPKDNPNKKFTNHDKDEYLANNVNTNDKGDVWIDLPKIGANVSKHFNDAMDSLSKSFNKATDSLYYGATNHPIRTVAELATGGAVGKKVVGFFKSFKFLSDWDKHSKEKLNEFLNSDEKAINSYYKDKKLFDIDKEAVEDKLSQITGIKGFEDRLKRSVEMSNNTGSSAKALAGFAGFTVYDKISDLFDYIDKATDSIPVVGQSKAVVQYYADRFTYTMDYGNRLNAGKGKLKTVASLLNPTSRLMVDTDTFGIADELSKVKMISIVGEGASYQQKLKRMNTATDEYRKSTDTHLAGALGNYIKSDKSQDTKEYLYNKYLQDSNLDRKDSDYKMLAKMNMGQRVEYELSILPIPREAMEKEFDKINVQYLDGKYDNPFSKGGK